MKFRNLLTTLILAIALLPGCTHLATPAEKEVSYRRFESLTVNGIGLSDFLQARTGIIVAGAQPVIQATRGQDVQIQLQPVGDDGFDIGSATAISTDGYFLTAAHCVKRKPLFLLVPADSGAKIIAARLVWHAVDSTICDVAIIKVEAGHRPAFEIAEDEQIRPAVDVVTAGANGLAGGKILNEAVAVEANAASDTPTVFAIVHSAPLAEGDSGGPLATIDGKLMGIEVLARGLPLGKAQGIALRPDLRWIEQLIKKDRERQLRDNASTTEGAPR